MTRSWPCSALADVVPGTLADRVARVAPQVEDPGAESPPSRGRRAPARRLRRHAATLRAERAWLAAATPEQRAWRIHSAKIRPESGVTTAEAAEPIGGADPRTRGVRADLGAGDGERLYTGAQVELLGRSSRIFAVDRDFSARFRQQDTSPNAVGEERMRPTGLQWLSPTSRVRLADLPCAAQTSIDARGNDLFAITPPVLPCAGMRTSFWREAGLSPVCAAVGCVVCADTLTAAPPPGPVGCSGPILSKADRSCLGAGCVRGPPRRQLSWAIATVGRIRRQPPLRGVRIGPRMAGQLPSQRWPA